MGFHIEFSKELNTNSELFSEDFLKAKLSEFKKTINDPQYGFFHVSDRDDLRKESKKVFEKFKERKNFIHVGIGGSSLGPEMLISALSSIPHDKNFVFINNIDPDETYNQIKDLSPDDSLFYFVSKSGGTAETMAGLAIISHWLEEKGIQKENFKNYFIFATDPEKSQLLDLGKELEVETLTIPSNIGGRFSVLTAVGYLPALMANIDIDNLCDGANLIKNDLLNENVSENILLQTASYLAQLKELGVSQTVLMPYSSQLKCFSYWFTQLWAESLGKKLSLSNDVVHEGFTPIPAYGATDQHSQVQLFMEGPHDKCVVLIEVDSFDHDYTLENNYSQPSLTKLAPFTLSQLFKAELEGTIKALDEAGRPFIHIKISKKDERNLGAMILFFESLTALMGHYLMINPFNQPGVEAGKKFAQEWLENPTGGE